MKERFLNLALIENWVAPEGIATENSNYGSVQELSRYHPHEDYPQWQCLTRKIGEGIGAYIQMSSRNPNGFNDVADQLLSSMKFRVKPDGLGGFILFATGSAENENQVVNTTRGKLMIQEWRISQEITDVTENSCTRTFFDQLRWINLDDPNSERFDTDWEWIWVQDLAGSE